VALVVAINMALLGGSAYLVYSLLQRYAAAQPEESVRLGVPRVVGTTRPSPDAARRGADAAPAATPTPTSKGPRRPPRPTPKAVAGGEQQPDAAFSPGADATPAVRTPDAKAGTGSGTGTASSPEPDTAEQVRATLDADSVRMVVSHHMPQIRACYDRALKQQETIRGVVEIQFEISARGRVRESKVHRNTTAHVGLGACIANAIKGWRFPRPVAGEVTFIYPFVFSSGG